LRGEAGERRREKGRPSRSQRGEGGEAMVHAMLIRSGEREERESHGKESEGEEREALRPPWGKESLRRMRRSLLLP